MIIEPELYEILIFEMIQADKLAQRYTSPTPSTNLNTNLKQLQLFVNTHCKVTFRIWEKHDPNGRPSGTYDWTSIMGSDMKKVLTILPTKFDELLKP